jgi:hypothetical protein
MCNAERLVILCAGNTIALLAFEQAFREGHPAQWGLALNAGILFLAGIGLLARIFKGDRT